jgi:hypothetical protein
VEERYDQGTIELDHLSGGLKLEIFWKRVCTVAVQSREKHALPEGIPGLTNGHGHRPSRRVVRSVSFLTPDSHF